MSSNLKVDFKMIDMSVFDLDGSKAASQPKVNILFVDDIPDELKNLEIPNVTITRTNLSRLNMESQQIDSVIASQIQDEVSSSFDKKSGEANIHVVIASPRTSPTIFSELFNKPKSNVRYLISGDISEYTSEFINNLDYLHLESYYGIDHFVSSIRKEFS